LLVGDMNVAGRVYMASGGGRGLIYWEPTACTPTAITPYVQVNGGTWQQAAIATVNAGGSVLFGPQPVTGGSWSWSGPNNFSAATREAGISNIQVNQAGNYVATYTNSGGCQSTQTFNVTVTGSILREYWTGISGTAISNLTANANYPNNPSGSGQLTSLEAPTNWADNYGTRIRGYIHPATSGSYTFWVAGDDNTELYLSTSDNPAGATRIAYINGWTNSREWNKYSTQQSAAINLVAGQKYYIEVLHKEGSGGDNVAVAWQGPGITQQVIPGTNLSPFIPGGSSGTRIETPVNVINENAISLYPNPSNGGRFTVLLPANSENAVVRVYDNLGRLLYKKNAQGGNRIEIDSRLKAGLYTVTINSNAINFTSKLIVK
jgi:xyloglucan-specific exo-beta-1,4-glucanase